MEACKSVLHHVPNMSVFRWVPPWEEAPATGSRRLPLFPPCTASAWARPARPRRLIPSSAASTPTRSSTRRIASPTESRSVGCMHVVGLQYAIRNLQFQVLNLNIGRAFQYFTDVVCSLAMHNLGAFRGQHCRAGRGWRGKCKFITVGPS